MSWWKRSVLAAGALALASPAAAEPLLYQIQAANLVRVLYDGDVDVTYVPPLGEPATTMLIGSSDLFGRPSGTAEADVGLPDYFTGGQQGIYLSAFDSHADFMETGLLLSDVLDPVIVLLPAPSPIPLSGAALFLDIADLDVSLLSPISSSLVSFPDPNEYHWAGVAPVRISGSVNLILSIPGRDPIAAGPVPFDQTLDPAALAGSFTGDTIDDPTSTTLFVGFEDASVNPDTAPLIEEPIVVDLAPLGSIEVTLRRLRLVLNGNFKAVNRQYGIPDRTPFRGNPGAGCGIGPELAAVVPLLGWLWRRRRGA